jgi:phosphoglycolate phosphatase-like HAD superfamily hydrolase
MNINQKIFLENLRKVDAVYVDCDGTIFDNVPVMVKAKIFTCKYFFKVDPLKLKKKDVLKNLLYFYEKNPHMYKRKNFWVKESIRHLKEGIKQDPESLVDEVDIFRLSSKALGATFLKDKQLNINKIYKKFLKYFSKHSKNNQKYHIAKKHFLLEISQKKEELISVVSKEAYISDNFTSKLFFDLYFAVYHAFFTEKIIFHKYSNEILKKFNIFARKNKKEFGMISNREEGSLFLLLKHFNLLNKNYFDKKFVSGGDRLLGGKPGLVQFEKFVNKNQNLIYIGDSIIDFQTMVNFNKTYGKGSMFGVILPSKFEFNQEKIKKFYKQFKLHNVVVLSHEEIYQVLTFLD